MDYDENTLNSAPTMLGSGARRSAEPYDEPSLGSAPTMAPGRPGSVPAASSLGRIDQYDLVRKLGGGGFGVVYLARDTVSGVEVALKTLHPLLKANAEEMERLREKFALVSRLSHPNIATALVLHPVREVALADDEARRELRLFPGDSVMVMRYAPGVTLSKWRRQFPDGRVPLGQAIEIGRQIAAALDYAHGEKIIHRDIKPSNVMVETLPPEASRPSRSTANHGLRVRILDFGLAAEIRSSMSRVSTETGDTSGTRPYMAPEQWLGRKQDGRTDQYALACVLYELLAGEPPFAGVFETGDPIIMRTAVERDVPEEIDDVPATVNAALLKALAKDSKERFASCAEFMENCLAQSPRSSQRDSHAEARNGGTPWEREHPARGADSESGTVLESDVLRRKLAFARDLKALPEAVRADKEFSKFVSTAEEEMAVTEEACKFGRFVTAAESLNRVEAALDDLRKARVAREEAERRAKEEAERLAREKAEAERKAREKAEAERRRLAELKARGDAERKARERRMAREREAAWGRMQEESENISRAQEETESKVIRTGRRIAVWIVVVFAVLIGWRFYATKQAQKLTRPRQEWPRERKTGERGDNALPVTVGRVRFNLRWCPAGSFDVGSPDGTGDSDEHPRHRVTLTRGFWMSETEVTQGLWKEVMGENPSANPAGDNYPVENVSWDMCQKFLEKLNARSDLKPAGLSFALPTEAQWEYACRAGTTGDYGNTGRRDDMGWYDGNSGNKTHPVGQKQANAWDLHDMHGNVWEWCWDRYGSYPAGAVTDPTGPTWGGRVLRGGSFWNDAQSCRSANRIWGDPGYRYRSYGLRLVAF